MMEAYALILYAMELIHIETRITFDPIDCRRSEMRINWQRQTEFVKVPIEGGTFEAIIVVRAACVKAEPVHQIMRAGQ